MQVILKQKRKYDFICCKKKRLIDAKLRFFYSILTFFLVFAFPLLPGLSSAKLVMVGLCLYLALKRDSWLKLNKIICQHVGDVQQLVCRVVRKLDLVGEAAGKTAVGGKEHLHLPGVARQNDHQLVPVIIHALHKGVDGFHAKAVLLAAVEAVGFVDEQHAAQRTFNDAVCQRGGVAGACYPGSTPVRRP